MKKFIARCAAVALLAITVACAGLTINDQLGFGYATVTAVRQTSTRLLDQDRLSSEQGAASVALADEARRFLDTGFALSRQGDEAGAKADLDLARQVLDNLEAYLLTKSEEPAK